MYGCSLHAASFRAGDQVLGPNGKVEIVPVQFYNREATIVDLQTTSARLHVTTCHVSGSEGTSSRAAVGSAWTLPYPGPYLGAYQSLVSWPAVSPERKQCCGAGVCRIGCDSLMVGWNSLMVGCTSLGDKTHVNIFFVSRSTKRVFCP